MFVATSIILSREKKEEAFVATNTCFCCDRSFAATKMILVATPANDIYQGEECADSQHNRDKRNEVKIRNKNAGAGSGWGGRGGGGGVSGDERRGKGGGGLTAIKDSAYQTLISE